MRWIWLKDRFWLSACTAAGITVLTATLFDDGFDTRWVLPSRPSESFWLAGTLLAFALGAIAAVRDEATGTREFLWHRPLSRTRIHASTMGACAIVLATWLVVPAFIQWAVEWATGGHAAYGEPARVVDLWLVGAVMPSSCAVALFAGTMRTPWIVRVITGGAALLAVLAFTNTLSAVDGHHDATTWLTLHAAATLAFGFGSSVNVRDTADADRPWSAATRRTSGVLVAIAWAGITTLGTSGCQDEYVQELRWRRPAIVATSEGAVRLAFETSVREGTIWIPADPMHRIAGAPLHVAQPLLHRWSGNAGGHFGFDQPDFDVRSWNRGARAVAVLPASSGLAHVGWRGHRYLEFERFDVAGRAPDGTPFSPEARMLRTAVPDAVWVVDGGVLWRLPRNAEPRLFEPVELPDGDRFVDQQVVDTGDRELLPALDFDEDHQVLAVIGERGVYVVGDDVRPAPAAIRELVRARPEFEVVVDDPDPLAPVVRVIGRSGEERFRHAYAVRTPGERVFGGLALALSALRPPALEVVSHATTAAEEPSFGRRPHVDPLVAGGRRTWLVALSLATGACFAFAVHRRLRRRGATREAARIHALLTLTLGPAAGLAALAIDRRRAYASPPRAAVSEPPLIRSA